MNQQPSLWTQLLTGFLAGVRGAFRDIHAGWIVVSDWLAGLNPEPEDDPDADVTHDWKCDCCGHWNPDRRDENDCRYCEAPRASINEYRKHKP